MAVSTKNSLLREIEESVPELVSTSKNTSKTPAAFARKTAKTATIIAIWAQWLRIARIIGERSNCLVAVYWFGRKHAVLPG